MSNLTYAKVLSEATDLIDETLHQDSLHQTEILDEHQRRTACIELYYRYISAANKLNHCYDQMLQPQKRMLVRKLLDNCLGRILELRAELVEFDLSEYSWDDDVLLKLEMSPIEVELDIPEYFLHENMEEVTRRRQFISDTLLKLGYSFQESEKIELTEKEAVVVIQSHERARQGRLRGQFMKEIKQLKDKSRTHPVADNQKLLEKSALLIQKIWRGHKERRRVRELRMKEMILIKMIDDPKQDDHVYKKSAEIAEYRRTVQQKYKEDYEKALVEIENRIRDVNKDRLTDEFKEELSVWIEDYYKCTGKLPEFPSEESGGSKNLVTKIVFDSEASRSQISSKESSKKSLDKDRRSKSTDVKNKEEDATELESHKNAPSNFLSEIVATYEEFEENWKFRDETSNPSQSHYSDIIERDKEIEVEDEIRKTVDNLMRHELEQLQAAVDRDRALKGKKPKKPAKKKAKRTSKKAKKKREKDLTPDRTTESLFEELITNGIIKQYPLVRISEFIGEKSFAASEIAANGSEVDPCFGEIRELVKETCIIPLGSDYIHQAAPLARGVLITGPPGSGKKMLVHAICTELGAVLFDLTPANIVGKYPGKTGLIMLLHLVSKVSRLLQPSVIWMDYAERPFVKKIPKSDKTDPKRLKKDLYKLIKAICPEDRVIFIGTSYCPWDAEQKSLLQCYSRIITIPRPDYGTMSHFWKVQLAKIGGLQHDFNISTMARICDGYTLGTILAALESILTTKRKLQLFVRGLSSLEIVAALSKFDAVYWEQDELAYTWTSKLPLARRKAAQRRREAEALAAEEAAVALK